MPHETDQIVYRYQMLELKIPVETIVLVTGLSMDTIEKLK